MFPHNSSSHEISTETNAFVQNSMGDVVVLGKSSLVGVGEGRGSEHARYCDIESINSNMMAEPISHPEDTAANDFSTVLPSQTGEPSSGSIGSACQSVAPSTTKHPTTNHLLIYDNNNPKVNNNANDEEGEGEGEKEREKEGDKEDQEEKSKKREEEEEETAKNVVIRKMEAGEDDKDKEKEKDKDKNRDKNKKIECDEAENENENKLEKEKAEHNHHDERKQTTKAPGMHGPRRPCGSANNSKSMSKTLSDNKTSFSILNVRVLSISVNNVRLIGVLERGCCHVRGVPSLVRIFKSDRLPRGRRLSSDSLDNYSLLGSCLVPGDNNNVKSNSSLLSNNNDNYKSVILLSSTSNHYFLRVERDGAPAIAYMPVSPPSTRDHVHYYNHHDDDDDDDDDDDEDNDDGDDDDDVHNKNNNKNNNNKDDDEEYDLEEGEEEEEEKEKEEEEEGEEKDKDETEITLIGNASCVRWRRRRRQFIRVVASEATSSSITLIVPGNEVIDQQQRQHLQHLQQQQQQQQQPPRVFPMARIIAPYKRAQSSPSWLVVPRAGELTQRACVPLSLDLKLYDRQQSSRKDCDLSIITCYNNNKNKNNNDNINIIININDNNNSYDDNDDIKVKSNNDYVQAVKSNNNNCNNDCNNNNINNCNDDDNDDDEEDDDDDNSNNNNKNNTSDNIAKRTSSLTTRRGKRKRGRRRKKTSTAILHRKNTSSVSASRVNGISRTVATITVGALLFQDTDDKSNYYASPLLGEFYASSSRLGSDIILETDDDDNDNANDDNDNDNDNDKGSDSDYANDNGNNDDNDDDDGDDDKSVKSLSKSTLIAVRTMYRCKLGEDDSVLPPSSALYNTGGLAVVYIPITTTCNKPTMTLKRQSASRTIGVPGSRANYSSTRPDYFDVTKPLGERDQITRNATKTRSTITMTNARTNIAETLNTKQRRRRRRRGRRRRSRSTGEKEEEERQDQTTRDLTRENLEEHVSSRVREDPLLLERERFQSEQSWRGYLVERARTLIPTCLGDTTASVEEDERAVKGSTCGRKILERLFVLLARSYEKDRWIMNYRSRWSIPTILGLAGGGESSLNSGGAANWGSTQTSAPNNNNANQSGWGGTPGNPSGNSGAPGNWPGNNVNRSVAGNPNQNQNQGPPGGQNVPGNVSKVNNPNQQSSQQSGPPTSQSNNPSQGNQNNNQWPQGKSGNAGGPGQNPSVQNNNNNSVQQQQSGTSGNNNQSNNPSQGSVSSGGTPASNNPSTKQQLEQLNTMREALFSQDGWGCQHVNQDTNWDVPTSPEPSLTKDGVPMWKPSVNNGTDLWEANLRNGGQPPPQQQAKTPWGHTPATNIGGTWGEDDDTADSSNMWTNAPTPSQPNTGQWTAGAAGNQAGSNWGDPRIDHRDPRDLRSVDPREMRDPRDHRMSLDPRDHMRVMDPMARDPRMADMRSDPRGISGRLNGTNADAMWGQPPGPPHHQMGHQHPSGPPTKMLNPSNINQWAAPPPKDIMPGKPSGWEEPSPPTQRRNVPNYDDGTSLWGNPAANQRAMPGSKVSHWKDLPTPNLGRGGMQCPPGMPQNRMPGQPGMKPDVSGPMWGHPGAPGGRNGTWADGPHDTSSWDDPKTPATWNEAQLNPGTWGGPTAHKPKPMGPTTSWADSDMDPTPSWGHPAKPTLTKEVIWNSREFRYLCDLGFKKEDVELALRNREMNREEALELLSQLRPLDQWRRHDAHSGYDPTNQAATAPAYPRFNHVAQQMSFPPGAGVPSGTATGGVGGSVASASLLKLQQQQQQQAAVPLQQQQPSSNAPQPPFNQASRAPQNQPSAQQLRLLVQQIQLAVQEGYLNHQILNQPLAPQTLILLNQLLQQIKVLQQLHQQHSVQSAMKGNSQSVLQISVQITKTKQQIANLQNQIAVQQATYMKQQQQQQHPAPPSQTSEYYKTSVHDPMSALQNSFTDLTMNKEPPVSQQQSRLNQWKLPSLDKDGELVTNEFSRAPGTTRDGTWSSRLGESGWPDPGNTDSTDGKDWQSSSGAAGAGAASAAFTDLVPEFEPGKPWKGTQMKSIEDDPSITPGSVVRSPLSLATIKDPDAIFSSSSKTSPPPQPTNPDTSIPSLSNSTWTFNPPATTPSAFASSKNTWGETAPPPTAVTSELWGAPMSKVRGPPPGLGSKGGGNTSNGWAGLGTVGRSSSSWGFQSSSNAGWVSTWLLLKNLTPQIDGSTLKTLCMQHGPVQDFRLYLNHGIALTKYSSRDEAIKAQGALNNCVLGNTTIFAESPADSEVHTLLQQLSHGGQQQGAGTTGGGWSLRPSNKTGPPPDTWGGSSSQLWGAPPSTNSLWSNAGIDSSDQQRATPSSLNSYLPGDLLGDLRGQ